MNLLLDTHTFLWFLDGSPRLPARHRAAIEDRSNVVYVSFASLWEATLKHQTGKLVLPGPPEVILPAERDRLGFTPLDPGDGVLPHYAGLPLLHRDPFDRLLVAQALEHALTLVTVDAQVLQYPVPTLPAS